MSSILKAALGTTVLRMSMDPCITYNQWVALRGSVQQFQIRSRWLPGGPTATQIWNLHFEQQKKLFSSWGCLDPLGDRKVRRGVCKFVSGFHRTHSIYMTILAGATPLQSVHTAPVVIRGSDWQLCWSLKKKGN